MTNLCFPSHQRKAYDQRFSVIFEQYQRPSRWLQQGLGYKMAHPSYLPPRSEELGLRFSGKQPRKYLRRTTMFFCPNPPWPLPPGLLGCRSTTRPAQVFGAPGSLPEVASLTHLITVISILEVRIRQKAGCSDESLSALANQRAPPGLRSTTRRHISTQSN